MFETYWDDRDDEEAQKIVRKYVAVPEPRIKSFSDWYRLNKSSTPISPKKRTPSKINQSVPTSPVRTYAKYGDYKPLVHSPVPRKESPTSQQRTIYKRGYDGGYTYDRDDISPVRRWHYGKGADEWGRRFLLDPCPLHSVPVVGHENTSVNEASIKFQQSMMKLDGHIRNIDKMKTDDK